jgi:branched-chain amino acid transport system permease protein
MRSRVGAALLGRSEVLVLLAVLGATFLLPLGLPLGIGAEGIVSGSAIALQAMAVVLVYRANRLISFALPAAATLGATVFTELNRRASVLVLGHELCGSCVPTTRVNQFGHFYTVPVDMPAWSYHLNYWLSMAAGVLAAVLVTMILFGILHTQRMLTAPRLIATVFTIGASQVFALLGVLLLKTYHEAAALPTAPLPFSVRLVVGGIDFGAGDLLLVGSLVIAGIGLTYYLSRTTTGMLLRGASENPSRAQTLGVNTTAINSRAWLAAGVLAAAGGILGAVSPASGASAAGLVPVLAAAVVGGLTRLPLVVFAGLVLGIVERAALWSYSTTAAVDGVALIVIIAVLLAQRARAERVDRADTGFTQSRELRPIPVELRKLPPVVRWTATARFVCVAVALALPWLLSPSQTTLTVVVLVYAMVGLSLLVLTGWAGQISLGQLGIAAVGGYVTAILHAPFPIPLLVGGVAGAVAALVIGLPALRLRGLHLAVTTLAFGSAVASILINPAELGRHLPTYVSRPSFLGLDLGDDRTFYYVTLFILALVFLAVVGMRRSRTGRALIACRDNEALAQAFTINLVRARLSAFMMSGFLAAIAGGIYAYAAYGVSPNNFGVDQSINVFVVVVIGGLGSVIGPLLGAAYVGATTVFSSNSILALASTGLGLVTVLLFFPGGLGQLAYDVRDAFLRRVADRYKIDVPSLFADRVSSRLEVAPIAAKTASGGASVFVPVRYHPDDQWAVAMLQREHSRD